MKKNLLFLAIGLLSAGVLGAMGYFIVTSLVPNNARCPNCQREFRLPFEEGAEWRAMDPCPRCGNRYPPGMFHASYAREHRSEAEKQRDDERERQEAIDAEKRRKEEQQRLREEARANSEWRQKQFNSKLSPSQKAARKAAGID